MTGYVGGLDGLATANLPTATSSTYSSPNIREEPFIKAVPTTPEFLWGVALAAGQYETDLENDWTVFTTDNNSVEHMKWVALQATPPAQIDPRPPGVALRHDKFEIAEQELGRAGGKPIQSLDEAVDETAHVNGLGWRVDPGALLTVLRRVRDVYGLPVLITENGMADSNDSQRPSYTVAHADILARARAEGIKVQGYLHWSVTDNWEWHMSYQSEAGFGLFNVDRDQKDSGGRLNPSIEGTSCSKLRLLPAAPHVKRSTTRCLLRGEDRTY